MAVRGGRDRRKGRRGSGRGGALGALTSAKGRRRMVRGLRRRVGRMAAARGPWMNGEPQGGRSAANGAPTVLYWDIDGTLLSTARAGVFALEEGAQAVLGWRPDLSEMKTAGLTDHRIAARALEREGANASPEAVDEFIAEYERRLPEALPRRQGEVLPGVREILAALAGREDVLSVLLTGNTRTGARAKLDHYGLADHFADGAFSEDLGTRESIARRARVLATERLGGAAAGRSRLRDRRHPARRGRRARHRRPHGGRGHRRLRLRRARRARPVVGARAPAAAAEFTERLGIGGG